MTGSYLQDYEALRKVINGGSEAEGLRRLNSDSNVFYFPDDSVLGCFRNIVCRSRIVQDICRQWQLMYQKFITMVKKSGQNNEKLEILNHKLEEMYEKIGDKIREQETLAMKMQVHDKFWPKLLSIRRILERKENQDKMDEQLSALKHLVYILTDSSVENMEELCADTIRHAEELGIYVQISGNFPQHPSYRLLTDRAIRECVTNCARHAHGSTVLVKIEKGANEYSIRITNDGDAPEKKCRRRWWSVCTEKSCGVREMYYARFLFRRSFVWC